MSNMSALDQALDMLPLSVTVDDKAVKEAVIDEVAKQLCVSLRLSSSTFSVNDESMKQALASALIVTQQKVIANPPTFVKIQKKYQRRANTPAMSNVGNASSMSSDPSTVPHVLNGAGQSGSPEVSSSNILGPQSTMSGGSIGVADFMDPEVLKTAKLWRFQKLSKAELAGLLEHYTQATPSSSATKAQLIKTLMDYVAGDMQ